MGDGDEGGAGVEGEAILLEAAPPSARPVQPVDHGDAVAAGAKSHGGAQAAEPGADDHRVGPAVGRNGELLKIGGDGHTKSPSCGENRLAGQVMDGFDVATGRPERASS